jgi:hypothetical protein
MRVPHAPHARPRRGERGGSRLSFLLVVAVIGLVGYAVYQYAPVAYDAFKYKDFMRQTVEKATYPPGQTVAWVESQLRAGGREYGLAAEDLTMDVRNVEGQIVARVQWMRPVKMPGFIYEYKFDHTARSSGFVNAR